jgi:hypothetical protein
MFNRSRPWRARGPSLGSHAGSRRRGHCGDTQTIVPAANSQPDSTFEVTFADDFAGSEIAPATSASLIGTPLTVARIDEAGLRAMAWREREQSQGWVAEVAGPLPAERPIAGSPLELFMPTKRELTVIPRPRRSA